MILGAFAGSAVGLQYRGAEARGENEPAPDVSGEPVGGYFHPRGAWSSILEPAVVAAKAMGAAPGGPRTAQAVAHVVSGVARDIISWYYNGLWGSGDKPTQPPPQVSLAAASEKYASQPLTAVQHTPSMQFTCEALAYAIVGAGAPTPDRAVAVTEVLVTATCRFGRAEAVMAAAVLCALAKGGRGAAVAAAVAEARAHISADEWQDIKCAMLAAVSAEHPLRDIGGRDYGGRALSSFRAFFWAVARAVRGDAPGWAAAMGEVCKQGGTSDLNCALVGAVLGAAGPPGAVPAWARALDNAEPALALIRAAVAPAGR